MSYFTDLNSGKGIPFMDEREKGDKAELFDRVLHIDDFGFIDGENGEFPVVSFAEEPEKFYFLNSVIGDMLKQVSKDAMKEHLKTAPVKLYTRVSDKNREYMAYEFVDPDSAEAVPF